MVLQGKKILYLFDAKDWDSRYAVVQAVIDQGAQAVICLIGGSEKDLQRQTEAKIILLQKNNAIGKGFITPLGILLEIRKIITQEKPNIIHAITLKYSFVTALAAFATLKARGAQKIFTIAGLGYLYRSDELKSVILRSMLWPFLIFAFKQKQTKLIFQNDNDRMLLINKKVATAKTSYLVKGSGVYLNRFDASCAKENIKTQLPLVLMPTRLVHEKGVGVFIEAAKILKEKGINARFEIVGGLTRDNPRAITIKEMKAMIKEGVVTWLGHIDNIPEKLREAAMIVYPSYYGEGIARVLLESCAAGRAVITTDHPGCREAVDHEKNGLLVRVKDPKSTAQAIERLLKDPALCVEMGKKSRKKAEKEFDIHEIVKQTIKVYDIEV